MTLFHSPNHRTLLHAGVRRALPVMLAALVLCGSATAQIGGGIMQDGDAPSLRNDGVPKAVQDITVKQNLGDQISKDMPMIDADDRKVTLGDYLDGEHPLILTLNYSNCPMLCNVQLNHLAQSLEEGGLKLGSDFRCISISIDPSETKERLVETKAQYVEQVPSHPQAQTGWAFCRTTQEVIDQLATEVGFSYNYDPITKEYNHPAMLVFLTPDGVITRYSLGLAFPPDQMKLAIVEAGQGKVGSYIDQLLMLCYTYDPDANSYVAEAWKIMRLGGAFTVGLMALVLIPYWIGRKGSPNTARRKTTANEPQVASADGTVPLKPTQWFGG